MTRVSLQTLVMSFVPQKGKSYHNLRPGIECRQTALTYVNNVIFNWTGTLNRGIYIFWIPACIFRIVSTLHPQQSWGPAGLNFMQPCNFTHWSTRSSHYSCTCDWHPLNGSLLYTPLTPFCCSKTPQKNSPLNTVRNKNPNVFSRIWFWKAKCSVLSMAWQFWRKLSKGKIGLLIPRTAPKTQSWPKVEG